MTATTLPTNRRAHIPLAAAVLKLPSGITIEIVNASPSCVAALAQLA